jgi:hypothetical protein
VKPELDRLGDEPVEHPWLVPGQPPLILGAGGLRRQKDFPTLIRAFALLRRERACRVELREELQKRGHRFSTCSDCEVILHTPTWRMAWTSSSTSPACSRSRSTIGPARG